MVGSKQWILQEVLINKSTSKDISLLIPNEYTTHGGLVVTEDDDDDDDEEEEEEEEEA
jgi:hypothetical protein